MACKVYAHLDVEGRQQVTAPVMVPRPAEMQFGTIKQAFLEYCAAQHPEEGAMDYDTCCFWNQDHCPIADRTPVAMHVWEHNDFFLRPLPERANAESSALAASRKERGELSYYYAHDKRYGSGLVSKPQATAAIAPAPVAATPAPIQAPAGQKGFNFKQSPFGTEITGYETITTYNWEDHDNQVKVLLPLEGVGKLPPGAVRSQFGLRSFEVLIDGYNGKNLRFATHKTHGEMKAEECKHVVRANRVNLVLQKGKEKDIWFDLYKKRAIGDDDDP